MSNFYDDINDVLKRRGAKNAARVSRDWLRKRVKELARGIEPKEIMRERKRTYTQMPTVGNMYFYFYDPKTKATLPYYDKFPLTIVIKNYSDGFLGLNLHYLPPKARGELMARLLEIASDTKFDERTKLKVSYDLLDGIARYKAFKPCVKRYLYQQMKSKAMKIHSADWLPTVFLPMARFEGSTNSRVWSDSRLKYI